MVVGSSESLICSILTFFSTNLYIIAGNIFKYCLNKHCLLLEFSNIDELEKLESVCCFTWISQYTSFVKLPRVYIWKKCLSLISLLITVDLPAESTTEYYVLNLPNGITGAYKIVPYDAKPRMVSFTYAPITEANIPWHLIIRGLRARINNYSQHNNLPTGMSQTYRGLKASPKPQYVADVNIYVSKSLWGMLNCRKCVSSITANELLILILGDWISKPFDTIMTNHLLCAFMILVWLRIFFSI